MSAFLNDSDLLDKYQRHHSIESVLLKVLNDLLFAVDLDDSANLVLLDLRVAFLTPLTIPFCLNG